MEVDTKSKLDIKSVCKKIIVALDFKKKSEIEAFLDKFPAIADQDECSLRFVKVGMELFYAEGPEIIEFLKEKNLHIFLDLKVHDIPNTAAQAISSLAQKFGVDIVNVHASGGIEMMTKARESLDQTWANLKQKMLLDFNNQIEKPKLIGVTVLTSLDEQSFSSEMGVEFKLEDLVKKLACNSYQAGLDGVVCSALEAKMIKEAVPDARKFLTVCPGVRLETNSNDDQKRVMTPKAAIENGADYIVVGRAITKSENPFETFSEIVNSILK